MKRTLIGMSFLAFTAAPFVSFADEGPGCGLGSQVWKGKSGLLAHTSAGTTNGTLYNKYIGLSLGTLGCDADSVVYNDVEEKVFVSNNLDNLQQEIAQGNGDHLDTLAGLRGISANDRDAFYSVAQDNYDEMFASENATHETVLAVLDAAMTENAQLAKYIQ